jgi:hypothetical protein
LPRPPAAGWQSIRNGAVRLPSKTVVTRQAEAGATEPEIAAVTGHRLQTVAQTEEVCMVRPTALARAASKRRLAALPGAPTGADRSP